MVAVDAGDIETVMATWADCTPRVAMRSSDTDRRTASKAWRAATEPMATSEPLDAIACQCSGIR